MREQIKTSLLSGFATDDGLPTNPGSLTYEWSQISGPSTVGILSVTSTSTQINALNSVGSYIFQLKVFDGQLFGTSTVSITVNPSPDILPPVVTLNSHDGNGQLVIEGSTALDLLDFTITGSDQIMSGQLNSGLQSLSLILDGIVVASTTSNSLNYVLDIGTLNNVNHALVAKAKDNAGNIGFSQTFLLKKIGFLVGLQ